MGESLWLVHDSAGDATLVGPERQRKQIAIVGGSPLTSDLAPFDDPAWEIWVLGNQIDRYQGKRISRIFEIHDNLEAHGDTQQYFKLLASQGVPVVVGAKWARFGEVFPEGDAVDLIGGDFLSSSPAYMMAYAVLQGATHIGIYGVEMAVDDHEYFHQRPAMYAWITFARSRGIDVVIPQQSTLYRDCYREGRDWGARDLGPFSEAQLLEMAANHAQRAAAKKAEYQAHEGARQAYERMAKVARAMEGGIAVESLTESVDLR